MANPQSRNEAILQSIVDETAYTEIPKSREEKLLLEIKDLIEQGGTSDVQGLILTMNTTTYVITAYLIDGEGHQVGESQSIDIPLEATIIDASYNNTTKIITFTLTSGAYLSVPIGDIIYGLQPLIDAQHKLSASLVDDSQGRFKFLWVGTAAQWEIDGPNCPVGTPRLITDDIDIDLVPTNGSLNPVTSNGIFQELKKLKVINENPENHNGIYRGKNLTDVYTIEQIYERVHDGSFEDLYLGDYITVHLTTDLYTRFTGAEFVEGTTYYEMDSGTDVTQRTWTETQDAEPQEGKVYATKQVVEEDADYMIAGFDCYLYRGVAPDIIIDHNIVLIMRTKFSTKAFMHHDATAMQGYALSDIFNITLPCYAKSTKTAVNGHIIKRTTRRVTSVDPNIPSNVGCGWYGSSTTEAVVKSELDIPSINQMMGNDILSSSWRDSKGEPYKFPIYNFILPHTDNYSLPLSNVMGITNGKLAYSSLQMGGGLNGIYTNTNAFFKAYFVFG